MSCLEYLSHLNIEMIAYIGQCDLYLTIQVFVSSILRLVDR